MIHMIVLVLGVFDTISGILHSPRARMYSLLQHHIKTAMGSPAAER